MGKAIAPANDADINELIQRGNEGDRRALSALREVFDEYPGLWEECGNLALQAERALVAMVAGENEVTQEAMSRKLAAMREELAGSEPTPLERLVACWFQVQYADASYVRRIGDGGLSLEQGDYYQRRQDRAHRRYLPAIRTLAQVRRLLTPAVQVNIGARQVNVAQANSYKRAACHERFVAPTDTLSALACADGRLLQHARSGRESRTTSVPAPSVRRDGENVRETIHCRGCGAVMPKLRGPLPVAAYCRECAPGV